MLDRICNSVLIKSRVKSNSLDTTKFLIVNENIVNDSDTICKQFSQHFSQRYNTEIKTPINTFPMLTSSHLPKIEFTFTKIKQAIAVKNVLCQQT